MAKHYAVACAGPQARGKIAGTTDSPARPPKEPRTQMAAKPPWRNDESMLKILCFVVTLSGRSLIHQALGG